MYWRSVAPVFLAVYTCSYISEQTFWHCLTIRKPSAVDPVGNSHQYIIATSVQSLSRNIGISVLEGKKIKINVEADGK